MCPASVCVGGAAQLRSAMLAEPKSSFNVVSDHLLWISMASVVGVKPDGSVWVITAVEGLFGFGVAGTVNVVVFKVPRPPVTESTFPTFTARGQSLEMVHVTT